MLSPQELFENQYFSQKNVTLYWSVTLCSVIKGWLFGDVGSSESNHRPADLLNFGALSPSEYLLGQHAWGRSHGFLDTQAGHPESLLCSHLCSMAATSVLCALGCFSRHVSKEKELWS